MTTTSDSSKISRPDAAQFVTTHWSVVMAAAHRADTSASNALATLCETYWYPLYFYVRRRGYNAMDAQDLTQEFFARLLAGHWLNQANQQRGRFRSFLLTAMKHFLANEWHRIGAQKRGGHLPLTSLSQESAEGRYAQEPINPDTPERLFERRWAFTLLDGVLARLQEEYEQDGKGTLFQQLKPTLTVSRSQLGYPELARKLNLSEGAVRVAVHRLRQRYRQRLRAEVASTVVSPQEVEEEMQYLFRVLMGE